MSDKKIFRKGGVTKKEGGNPGNIITYSITTRSVDRSQKDVGDYLDAHRSAESVHAPNRTRLYDIYEIIKLDGHLTGIVQKRFDAVLNKEIFFERNGERVDAMDDVIASREFRSIMYTILETLLWGVSGLEFIPGKKIEFVKMPRKHIKIEKGIYANDQSSDAGYVIAEYPNLWVIGDKDDLGLFLRCVPYAIYKRGAVADWAQYVEIFGMPVRVIKYDAYDTQTRQELDRALNDSGSALEIRIPTQADYQILDGKASNGTGELQEKIKNALNNEMSVIILGNTETTSNDNGGSNAKSQTHSDQQLEITKSDIKYVTNMLNDEHFLAILKSYGLPVDGGRFVFAKEVDRAAIKEQVEIIDLVRGMGTPVDDDDVYKITGLPKPKDYEQQKAAKLAQAKQQEDEPEDDDQGTKPPKKPSPKKPGTRDLNDKGKSLAEMVKEAADKYLLRFFDEPRT